MRCPGCGSEFEVIVKDKTSSVVCPKCDGMFPAQFAEDLESFEKEKERRKEVIK